MYTYGHWISKIRFNFNEYFGFIYMITNKINNRKYIGKKNFIIKGRHRYHWKNYISSSAALKKDIRLLGKENFIFEILELHKSNNILSERERKVQVQYNVLKSKLPDGNNEFYNRSIYNVGFNTTGQPRSRNTCDAVDGSMFYYDPLTNECRRIKDLNKIPENFIKGRPPSVFSGRTGKNLFYNITTGTQIFLNPGDIVPSGYARGGSSKQHPRFKKGNDNIMADKTIYQFHNVITDEIFTGTQCEFKTYTMLPNWVSNVLCGRTQKTSKNWELTLDT